MLNDLFDLTYPEENLFPASLQLICDAHILHYSSTKGYRMTLRENLGPYTRALNFPSQLGQARTGRTGVWEPDRSSTAYCGISSYFLIRTMFKDPRKQISSMCRTFGLILSTGKKELFQRLFYFCLCMWAGIRTHAHG